MHDLSGELTAILITVWWLKKIEKYWQKLNNCAEFGCVEV